MACYWKETGLPLAIPRFRKAHPMLVGAAGGNGVPSGHGVW
jgi:hypothetical protein